MKESYGRMVLNGKRKDVRFSVGDYVEAKGQRSAFSGKRGIVVRVTDRPSRFVVRFPDGPYVVFGREIQKV